MRIVFLLDNNEYVEIDPTRLQLRQIAPGQAALGLEVTVPVRNEDGTPVVVDGVAQTQLAFRPFVNYPVDLVLPKPVEAPASAAVEVAPSAPAAPKAKRQRKGK